MGGWVRVARAEDLPPGSHRVVDVDRAHVVVFNLADSFYAIEDVCTHEQQVLSEGEVQDGEIVCPRHGAHFDLETGEARVPPAYEAVATFPVRVHGGMVQLGWNARPPNGV